MWNQKQRRHIFKLGFTSYNAEQPLQGMKLQEKEEENGYRIQFNFAKHNLFDILPLSCF